MPKGCVISHGLTEHWSRYTERLCALDDDDVIFTAAPLFHIGGQTPLLAAVACGLTIALETRFSASGYLRRVQETGATVAVGVGWIAQALLKQPPGPHDRDHGLRAMSTVQLSVDEQQAFLDRFGVRTLIQQYGQTECYPISYNVFDEQVVSPYAGKPTPELIVGILDDEGRELEPGQVGEISIRPRRPHVMFDRYWENPAATAKAFEGLWYHTGDLGRLVDGEIQYVDRKKDSMRRRGENVSAFEVERALLKFPSVAQAAVHAVKVPDEIDDSIKACIVVKPDEELVLAELASHLQGELPYFAVPQFIEVFEQLPTNAAGRVMKDALRERGITDSTLDLTALGLGVGKASRRAPAPTS
jgi:crotonobetaine/carnitine-CoA ligase